MTAERICANHKALPDFTETIRQPEDAESLAFRIYGLAVSGYAASDSTLNVDVRTPLGELFETIARLSLKMADEIDAIERKVAGQ